MIDIIDLVERIKRYAKLDYLQVVITDKGNLVLYDYEEKRTLRNCKNKLCHNIIALEWLKNEALATSEYDCELDNAIEYLKKNRRKGRKMKYQAQIRHINGDIITTIWDDNRDRFIMEVELARKDTVKYLGECNTEYNNDDLFIKVV